jgi:SpoVK/Ycf46/Vps4 family AAA+-type ATPase
VLAQQLDSKEQYVEQLATCLEELRTRVESLTAHEHYEVVVTDVERNGSLVVEVAGLGPTRMRIAIHPDVDPQQLLVGATGLVSRERNCLLQLIAPTGRWRHVATFERDLTPHRILVKDDQGTLTAIDLAHSLRETPLRHGDLIGFDRDSGLAYTRLIPPAGEHLFDEQVRDDFSVLGGLDREIAVLRRHIDFRFVHPELAGKYLLGNRWGILLEGPPGNGKTRLARCCAGYMRQRFPDRRCLFMHVSGSADYSMWFGESERRIVERFDAIREAARDGLVVALWDEVDAIAKRRGTDYGSGAADRVLNTFLAQLDGVNPLENVILIFATNRIDILDPSFLRPGRVHRKIRIPTPNRRAAESILRGYLDRGLPLRDDIDALIAPLIARLYAPNGEYAEVAQVRLNDGRRLPVAGRQLLSGAMLENVVSTAAQAAAVREAESGAEGLAEGDLSSALDAELRAAASLLAPGNIKSYVRSIPQDAQPIAVDVILDGSTSPYVR